MVRRTLRERKEKKGQEGTGNKRDNERWKVSFIIILECFLFIYFFYNICYLSSYIRLD